MPVMIATGCPIEVTLIAPTTHCAVTQGPLPGGGTKAHPATTYGAAIVAIGMPVTVTRGLGAVGVACPPCEQRTVAPTCKIGPGMLNYRQSTHVDIHDWADECDHGAFAVADEDALIVDDNHCAGRAL